jgi:allene oxide cyclase
MRKKLALVAAGLLVAGGGVIASLVASPAASAATTLTVVEHAVTDTVIDVGKAGDSTGDLLTFHNKVYDEADAAVVGSDQGSCIRITKFLSNQKGSWECQWTTFLDSGASSITVESPYYDTGLGVGAITGGTGTYVGASGSFDLSCTKTECTFTFNLS